MIPVQTTAEARVIAHRLGFAKALRDIADMVLGNPDFPVPRFPNITVSVTHGTDEQEREEVRRAARAMGVEPQWTTEGRTHYEAKLKFGPIEYTVTAITADHMDRYNAATTYSGAVTP